MATLDAPYGLSLDGPIPAPTDGEVLDSGVEVYTDERNISPCRIERWVTMVAERSGQKVDWCRQDGQIVVLALGDISAVREAVGFLRPELTKLYLGYLELLGERAN